MSSFARHGSRPTTHAAPTPILQRACACGQHTPGGGECASCKQKRLQRSAAGAGPATAPPIVHEVLGTGGQPLDAATRSFMEPRFGWELSRVPATASQHIESLHSGDTLRVLALRADGSPSLQRLPFGISLPTGLRWLDPTEEAIARSVYGSSLQFFRIFLSDALGGGGRPFTTYVPSPIPGVSGATVINIGPSAYTTPGSNPDLLIHELAHSWQSQHHSAPAAFMANSVASQAAAALAGGSAYCYVPGKWFGLYGAEQIAQQVERRESAIVSHVAAASAGSIDIANVISLTVPRWEKSGDPGVRC